MKNRKAKLASLGLAVAGSMALAGVGGQGVFASNPYNIVYSGGTALGDSNVTFLEEGVDFKALFNPNPPDGATNNISTSGADGTSDNIGWKTGYVNHVSPTRDSQGNITKEGTCVPVHYLDVPLNVSKNYSRDELYFSYILERDDFRETITVTGIAFDEIPLKEGANGEVPRVAIVFNNGSIGAMGAVYSRETADCRNNVGSGGEGQVTNIRHLYNSNDGEPSPDNGVINGGKIFVKTDVKLEKKVGNTYSLFSSKDLYFGITDIDRGQSYKITGGNSFAGQDRRLFATDATRRNEKLQPTSGQSPEGYRNKYVDEYSGYIYSQYYENQSGPYAPFDISGDGAGASSVFVKIVDNEGAAKIGVIFGYGAPANSSTRFYHKTYTVQYKSINGTITGITDEDVISGANPSGSKQTPNAHYEFEYWTADVDVDIKDGNVTRTIKAGEKISMEQIANVVVDKNIIFTAHNKTFVVEYKSDDHGKITGTTKENRNSNEHPGGSTQEADANYEFAYWICDKDVELTDGTKIAAGQPITDEQLTQVKINQNLVFTAIHKTKPNTPNTGTFTKDGDNVVQVISLILATLASAGFAGSYIVKRKKSIVKFNK